jgi:chemotaxis signal transduction protein
MKPSKFLVFKVDTQHYVVKNHCVVDIVENPGAYNRGNKQKCGVRFNGKDVAIIELNISAESSNEINKSFNSVLIIELNVGNSKEFIGIGLDEVVGVVPFEELLLNSTIPYSAINPNCQHMPVMQYNNNHVIMLTNDDLLKSHIPEAAMKHRFSYIPN